jgi:hypothetical protein
MKKARYFLNFVEEGILNPKYYGYTGGRVEVSVAGAISSYPIEELRFFTKDPKFYLFREKWDFRTVKDLDKFKKLLEKYHETCS